MCVCVYVCACVCVYACARVCVCVYMCTLNCTREMARVAAMGQSVSAQSMVQPRSRRELFHGRRPVQVAMWNVRSLVRECRW